MKTKLMIAIFLVTVIMVLGVISTLNNGNIKRPSWVPTSDGPWNNSLMFAISEDSLNFVKTEKTLVEWGGVPDMIYDYEKERIIAIFQYFSFEKEEEFDKIAVSFSNDEGDTWTNSQVITFQGLPESLRNPVDPALALLEDGRYRLYFTSASFDGVGADTYSAISNDCINFIFEEGIRFMDDEKKVLDPAILKIGDRWHYYSHVLEPGTIIAYHAVSEDGLNFKREENIIGLDQMLGNGVAVDGGYRFYYNAPRGTRGTASAFSTDGYNWTVDPGIRMSDGGDPGVICLKNGTYLMLYTTINTN